MPHRHDVAMANYTFDKSGLAIYGGIPLAEGASIASTAGIG